MRIEAFTRYNEMTGDAYVMDYTQATAGKRKVCIKEEDPDDIASFHLINPRKTTYWAVRKPGNALLSRFDLRYVAESTAD